MSNDNKRILKNGFFSTVQICVSTASYILIYYLVISKLGKDHLGAWSIITSIPTALTVFGSGVSGCILRYVPIYISQSDTKKFNQIIFNGTLFNALLAGVIVIIGYQFSSPILRTLLSRNTIPELYLNVFQVTLITFFLNFISTVFLYSIDGLQLIYKKNVIVMISSIVFCVASGVFIHTWGLMGLIYAQITQASVVLILALYVLIREECFHLGELTFSRSHMKIFLTFGQSFQYISLSILIFEPITKFFLNKYFNLSTVGIYEVVNRMITQVRNVIVNAVQVITPVVAKQEEERTLNINELYSKAVRGSALLSALSFSTLIIFVVPTVSLMDPEHFRYYLIFLIFLSIASICNVLCATAYSIYAGLGKMKSIVISHVLSTTLNICLFELLRYKPIPELMILPPAFAISISSLYIIYRFKKEYQTTYSPSFEDTMAYIILLGSVIVSLIFYTISVGIYLLFAVGLIHVVVVIYLMFKNTFMVGIREKLISNFKVNYES